VSNIKIMRRLSIALGLALLLCGCSHKEKVVPLAFYLSAPAVTGQPTHAEDKPSLVVSRLEFVAPDAGQRKVAIKLKDKDAKEFEALTAKNIGRTLILVQGGNVVADATLSEAIPPEAGIRVDVNPNIDFERACLNLIKLSGSNRPTPDRHPLQQTSGPSGY
jgi:hypothetical protein